MTKAKLLSEWINYLLSGSSSKSPEAFYILGSAQKYLSGLQFEKCSSRMSTSTDSVLSNQTLCRLLKLDFIIMDDMLQACFSLVFLVHLVPATSSMFIFCGICTCLFLFLSNINEEDEEPKNWKVSKEWFGDELICSLV